MHTGDGSFSGSPDGMFCILLQTLCWHFCGVRIFVTQPLFAALWTHHTHNVEEKSIIINGWKHFFCFCFKEAKVFICFFKTVWTYFFKKRFQQLAPPVGTSLVHRMTSTQSFVWDIFIILPKLYIFYKYFLNTGIVTPSISFHFSFSLQLSDFTATEMSCNNPV